jgi:SulP family sulfate permease
MAELTKVFGIDLGTTYSAVAHIDEFDRAVIVPNDINELTEAMLIVLRAGGFAGGGIIVYYFPSSVIKGMLAGIGMIIILKQILYALGCDTNLEGDLSLDELNQQNSITKWYNIICSTNPGAVLITGISLFILIFWEKVLTNKHKIFQIIPGPLAAVIAGILINWSFQLGLFPFSLDETELVNIPVSANTFDFFKQFTLPDFSQLTNIKVYKIAITMAVIASVETLLCVEATDKLDPDKRVTPTNRELKAQGVGNIVSGLLGGLPLSQVIVRSSANINFGAKTKMSTIFHGFLLLICAISIPHLLNMIPLATLASILFIVGYKLTKPSLFIKIYKFIILINGLLSFRIPN